MLEQAAASDLWRALGNPVRRQILDDLRAGPRTTGDLASRLPKLSRFAVMQHLGVLVDAGLVVVRRRGRERFNYLNPVPLRRWYERWVVPLADVAASEMVALDRHLSAQPGEDTVADADQVRVIRIATELRFKATPERVFSAIAEESLKWFPMTYGEDRTKGIVLEPRVGGAHYEDWGDGRGHLYGQVLEYDRPNLLTTRGWIHAGTINDTEYKFEREGEETVLKVSRVVVGPMTEQEAAGIKQYGDVAMFEDALRKVVEAD
jgi:DNA-binding transcriptional ArsR family regulator/uncharacterized protein YndB with AHSA1/START domain